MSAPPPVTGTPPPAAAERTGRLIVAPPELLADAPPADPSKATEVPRTIVSVRRGAIPPSWSAAPTLSLAGLPTSHEVRHGILQKSSERPGGAMSLARPPYGGYRRACQGPPDYSSAAWAGSATPADR